MSTENTDNSPDPKAAARRADDLRDTVYLPTPLVSDANQAAQPAPKQATETPVDETAAPSADKAAASSGDVAAAAAAAAADTETPSADAETDAAAPTTPSTSGTLFEQEPSGIHVSHLTRKFGRFEVLKDVSFTAEPGKITALIGPNGSGKTTLMLILASLLKPNNGEVTVAGLNPAVDGTRLHSRIGWMPDTIGIWSTLSPRQALRAIAKLYDIDSANAKLRAEELLRELDLSELARKPAQALSRGQRQRLSFARAIIHDPDVLILDEPMSGLDPQARVSMRMQLRRLAEEGKTILISSHILAELEEFADTAVYIDHGVTVDAETAAALAQTRRVWLLVPLNMEDAIGQLQAIKIPFARSGNKIKLETEDSAAAAGLLTTIVAGGVDVIEFKPEVGTLEATLAGIQSQGAAPQPPASTDKEVAL